MIENTAPNKTIAYSATTNGLGEGVRVGAGASYIFSDFTNGEIDFSHLSKTICKNTGLLFYQATKSGDIHYRYTQPRNTAYTTKLLHLLPTLPSKAIVRPHYSIYFNTGAGLKFRSGSTRTERPAAKIQMAWHGFLKDLFPDNTERQDCGLCKPVLIFMQVFSNGENHRKSQGVCGSSIHPLRIRNKNRILINYTLNGKGMINT